MILEIESRSKNEKYIYVKDGEEVLEKLEVEGDLIQELKEFLKRKGWKLEDFDDFRAVSTESFTGYRGAATVVNVLRHFVKGVPIEGLEYPDYHKEPNITISEKNS